MKSGRGLASISTPESEGCSESHSPEVNHLHSPLRVNGASSLIDERPDTISDNMSYMSLEVNTAGTGSVRVRSLVTMLPRDCL